jgi:putative transposase
VRGNYIRLPKVGEVRIAKHRSPKNGWMIKSATVERTPTGKYYISVLYEFQKDVQPVEIKDALGLDYSSHDFYVDSNGDRANYPRYYRKMEEKLAREQQKLSRKKYGSWNYLKQKKKVALIHEKIANQRRNFCHTLSAAIAKQYDAVFVEDINLRGLAGSLHLGKSTNDNGFGMFREMLNYKLAEQGKVFLKVERFFASSQICSVCGEKNPITKDLSVREWTCPHCGAHHDRDHNAANNILRRGLELHSAA